MNNSYLTFIRELPKSFSQIGAMLPSSPALGRAMVRPIREAKRPLNILEVGPGNWTVYSPNPEAHEPGGYVYNLRN